MPAKKKSAISKVKLKKEKVEKKVEAAEVKSEEVVIEKETRPYHQGVGRRKTSVAIVKIFPNGKGEIIVNGKHGEAYFAEPHFFDIILAPLVTVNMVHNFDYKIKVNGGGKHSQAEAVRHGIARAIVNFDQETRTSLKKLGFLRRDARAKERKKYGLKRARKGPQFSKR